MNKYGCSIGAWDVGHIPLIIAIPKEKSVEKMF